MTNFTQVFQPIPSWLNWPITFNGFITSSTDKHYSLDSEEDFRSGCRNVSHQQQFFSEQLSPRRSQHTNHFPQLHNTLTWISPKPKNICQKGKCHSSLLWKAFQIGNNNYFLLHRHFKGDGHSKELPFLSSPTLSKHSAFALIEVSASEVQAILEKFVSKEATSDLAARPCLCDVISCNSKLAGMRQICDLLAPFMMPVKSFFFSSNYPLHYVQCYHFGVWCMFGWKWYGSRAVITQSGS